MAKGKHGASKARRDEMALASEIAELEARIAEERARLAAAAAGVEEAARLHSQVAAEHQARDATLAGELADLEAEYRRLAPMAADAEAAYAEVRRRWDRAIRIASATFGGGPNGMIAVSAYLARDEPIGMIRDDTGDPSGTLSMKRIAQLQRARRGRTLDGRVDFDGNDWSLPLLRPAVLTALQMIGGAQGEPEVVPKAFEDAIHDEQLKPRADPKSLGAPTGVDREFGMVVQSAVGLLAASEFNLSLTVRAAWAKSSWVRPEWTAAQAPEALGLLGAVTGDESLIAWASGAGALPLRSLDAQEAARRASAVVQSAGRMRTATAPLPRFPRPGDAVALRHWYGAVAAGENVWATERRLPETAVPGDEATWVSEPELAGALDGLLHRLRTAVPYWLPAGQTWGYLDSEPLSAEDVEEIRMPFGAVIVVPADPPVLEPYGQPVLSDAAERLARLDRSFVVAHGRDVSMRERWAAASRHGLSVGDALALRPARVEAVLLFADAAGKLVDPMAWCLAMPNADGTGILGRCVVPAARSRSIYHAEVEQLAAVVSWGHWHAPADHLALDDDLTEKQVAEIAQTAEFKRSEARGGVAGVRVLDATSMKAADSASSEPTGRSVAPHLRRGHWRRQRFGPGRAEVKRIRIAPAVVNAQRGPLHAQVYRLRAPVEGET